MLTFDSDTQIVVGNMSWVDHSDLWVCNASTRDVMTFGTSGRWITLKRYGDILRITNKGEMPASLELRLFSDLSNSAAAVEVDENGATTTKGCSELWGMVDQCSIVRGRGLSKILQYLPETRDARFVDISWWIDGPFELMYQGLADCITLNEQQILIVSVQRSSILNIVDLTINKKVGEIPLANRGGNPELRMAGDGTLLATDYDTLCAVDLKSFKMTRAVRLEPAHENFRRFIGGLYVQGSHVLVARPFSADVLLVRNNDFEIVSRASTGGQPLEAVPVSSDDVLARDWKTGEVFTGVWSEA